MSFGKTQPNSQDFSSHRRNSDHSDLSKDPASQNQSGLTTLIESVEAPEFQPSAFPNSASPWPFNTSRVPALENASLSSTFSTSLHLHPQDSTTSLHTTSSLPSSFYDHHDPTYSENSYSESYSEPSYSEQYTEHTDQTSFVDDNSKEQLPTEHPRGLGIAPFPMSVASGSYFAGPMQPNSHQYVWANRPFHPVQPPPGQLNQQFPPSQPYPPSGFHVGYGSPQGGPLPGYHHTSPAPSSYLPGAPATSRPPHSRSPSSIARTFPPHSAAGLPNQPIIASSSPPYMMNQPAYYLPEAPQIPSSHPSSMSSQTSSMVAEPVFSQSESAPGSDGDVRLMTSRPRPQCWDHGCNGREFSTFSNLLRHQREKSGVVAKAECPICGAVFTRTTARNIHVAQGKCKGAGREASTE